MDGIEEDRIVYYSQHQRSRPSIRPGNCHGGQSGTDHRHDNDRFAAAAQSSGANLHAGGSVWETLKFTIWPTESLLFGLLAASFAGEVKNPARNQLVGIVGGMVVAGLMMILLEFLARKAIGDDFLRSASYLSANGSKAYTLPDAKLPFLISILSGSPVLTVLVNLWFVARSLLLPGACLIYSSRVMFADGSAEEARRLLSARRPGASGIPVAGLAAVQ